MAQPRNRDGFRRARARPNNPLRARIEICRPGLRLIVRQRLRFPPGQRHHFSDPNVLYRGDPGLEEHRNYAVRFHRSDAVGIKINLPCHTSEPGGHQEHFVFRFAETTPVARSMAQKPQRFCNQISEFGRALDWGIVGNAGPAFAV